MAALMTLELHHAHPWDLTPREAVAVQRELAEHVREVPLPHPPRTVAGLDVSIRGDVAQVAIAVLDAQTLGLVEESVLRGPVTFPYVPGLLSFREIPMILPALERLSALPDVLMLDGQGRAHPRRMGLACHLGVLLDRPALGVAKSVLVGRFGDLAPDKGAHVPMHHRDEIVGEAVRTRANVSPVYVSVGHRITLAEAVSLTLATSGRYRIPEPTRQAHLLSRRTP